MDVAILAAVIRHELEHLRGGGEREARTAERVLFQRLIFVGKVPVAEGLAYLADLDRIARSARGDEPADTARWRPSAAGDACRIDAHHIECW